MKKICFLLCVLFLSLAALAQVCPAGNNFQHNEVDNLGGPGEDATLNPFTYTYVPGAGTNRLLLLFISYETEGTTAANNLSGVTFGGMALTSSTNAQSHQNAANPYSLARIYHLREVDIAAAVGNTVSINFTAAASIRGLAVTTVLLQNVRQSTPVTNSQNVSNGPATTIQTGFATGATGGNYIFSMANMSDPLAPVTPSGAGHKLLTSRDVISSHTHSVAYKQLPVSASERPGFTASTTYPQAALATVEVFAATNTGSVCPTVLPVRLVSFTGKKGSKGVYLQWKTEDESGIAGYEVQKSIKSGSEFTTITSVPARNSFGPFIYAVNDAVQTEGISYYRLAIKDKDGTVTYSSTVKVHQASLSFLMRATTILTNVVELAVSSAGAQTARLSLTDNTGKQVWQKTTLLQSGTNVIPVVTLPAGLYYLTVRTEKENHSFKLFKH